MTALHILHTPMEEIHREPDGEERWCFVCRKRRTFEYVVTRPIVEPPQPGKEDEYEFPTGAYYGPTHQISCATCDTIDGDMFPGTYREWED